MDTCSVVNLARDPRLRMAVRSVLLSLLLFLFLATPVFDPVAADSYVLYVDGASGADAGNCQNSLAPCATIAYALSQAAAGDNVLVAGGTYVENLEVRTAVALLGGHEPGSWTRDLAHQPTIIDGSGAETHSARRDGQGVVKLAESGHGAPWTSLPDASVLEPGDPGRLSGPVVTFEGGSQGSTLDGFTITGGSGADAGGVLAQAAGNVAIRNCWITGNSADGTPFSSGGGGVNGYDLTIEDSVIINNHVLAGAGGVRVGPGFLTMVNTLVADNHGDMAIHGNGPIDLFNVTIAGNDGGVLCNPPGEATLNITNSIIWQNQWSISEDPPITRNVTYSIIEGGWTGQGNLDADPQFVDPGSGDYHLLAWSPAIDAGLAAGAPDHDLDGDTRQQNDGVDIGADEFVGQPVVKECHRYVALFGSDDGANTCLVSTAPCATIGQAVQAALGGETVCVGPGVFQENLEIVGKAIAIQGGYELPGALHAAAAEPTVVDGGAIGRTFHIHGASRVRLAHLTIQNGRAPEEACWGAGVNVSNAQVTIQHARITHNQALCTSGQSGRGAGAALNVVQDEGPATLHVEDSFALDNEAGDHGSGLAMDGATAVFTNVVVSGNSHHVLAIHNSDFRMVNSTVAENHTDGAALLDFDSNAQVSVLNSILWHSGGVNCGQGSGTCEISYSIVEGGWPGEGNLDADPLFLDAATGDFRPALRSPAIDAGSPEGAPALDIAGRERDAAPDIGAFEWQGVRVYLPLQLSAPVEEEVQNLVGEWTGTLAGFEEASASGAAVQRRDAPFRLVLKAFVRAKGIPNSYVGAGHAAVGGGAQAAPAAVRATAKGGGVYDIVVVAASAAAGRVAGVEIAGAISAAGPAIATHSAAGTWRTPLAAGAWSGAHASSAGEAATPVNQIPGLGIHGSLVTALVECQRAGCQNLTDFDILTNIPSAGAEVVMPGGAKTALAPYSDLFSPEVDFTGEFRYSARISGAPTAGAPYVFRLLDATGESIPGAEATEVCPGCPIGPPRNHVANPRGGTAVSITFSWTPVANALSYQVEIGNEGGVYFGASNVTTAQHVIPWAGFGGGAPGTPDGQDMGQSLSELPEGQYYIMVGSSSADCFAVDHGAELHFSKQGDTITFL